MSYPPTPQRKACDCSDPCISTDDVYYAGPNLPNSGINTYNVLTSVIEKLDAIYAVPTLQRVTEMGNYTTLPIIADSFVKIGGDGTNLLLDNGTVLPIGDLPIPIFNPSDYDLDEFTNTGIDPFAHVSDIPSAPGLQEVLDIDTYAEVDGGNSYVDILGDTFGNKYFDFTSANGIYGVGQLSSQIYTDNTTSYLINTLNNDTSRIKATNGNVELHRQANEIGKKTVATFNRPTQDTILNFPAKSVAGTYTLATLDDIPTLPTLTSGTYTPTVASIVNTSGGSTNRLSTYTRIGNIVSVKADVLITFTAALTESIFSITLPVPFSTAEGTQYVGSAISSATPYDSGFVQIVTTTASVYMKPTNSGTARIVITFTYRAA